ncbi:protein of unknown function [Xenorhabdus poinarii G6]|uniref:Uncharacterized protein n=1 Tax=Xenorhabdus poinarii G6 TaxID=1354304 RepID=A0A068QXY0_9GAMM|nr:protein of unknown function [Xenorhabdus poinarii G6]
MSIDIKKNKGIDFNRAFIMELVEQPKRISPSYSHATDVRVGE